MNMKYHQLVLALLVFTTMITFKSLAQTYNKIEYPYVGRSTIDYVCIKAITFSTYETRIDFISCYSGNYIFLEKPGQRNAMYIKIGTRRYKLKNTYGIASTDRITFCQPGQLLEFSAVFEPIPDKERDNFDLIEGFDGGWNFYTVSISKYLSRQKVPDLYAIGKRNWDEKNYKEKVVEYPYVEEQNSSYLIITTIKKLKDYTIIYFHYKNPNEGAGWMEISKDIYLKTIDGKKYNVISSTGISLSPDGFRFEKQGESINFCLVFPKLPNDVEVFSIYEPGYGGFSFDNVKLITDYQAYTTRYNNMEKLLKKSISVKTTKKKLKKDPNFKID